MTSYPFDIQECNGTISLDTESSFFVRLIAKNLSYDGPENLMKYNFKNISFIETGQVIRISFEDHDVLINFKSHFTGWQFYYIHDYNEKVDYHRISDNNATNNTNCSCKKIDYSTN